MSNSPENSGQCLDPRCITIIENYKKWGLPYQELQGCFEQGLTYEEWEAEARASDGLGLWLQKAGDTLEYHANLKALGPAAKLVRYLLALALKAGARNDPSREAHIFIPHYALAAALGVSERTVERWRSDPRYQDELRAWLAWEVWYTQDPELQDGIARQKAKAREVTSDLKKGGNPEDLRPTALKGGMVWRIRVRPIHRRPGQCIRVLAPYLRLKWRDLAADRTSGRTQKGLAKQGSGEMSGYKEHQENTEGLNTQVIVGRPKLDVKVNTLEALIPTSLGAWLSPHAIGRGMAALWDWAKQAANEVCKKLGERNPRALKTWQNYLLAAYKQWHHGGGNSFGVLERAIHIAKEAFDDGFARNPGAYAQGKLKKLGFFDSVAKYSSLPLSGNGSKA